MGGKYNWRIRRLSREGTGAWGTGYGPLVSQTQMIRVMLLTGGALMVFIGTEEGRFSILRMRWLIDSFLQKSSVKNVFIRGSVVRYVHLPGSAVDTALLEDATRRGRVTSPLLCIYECLGATYTNRYLVS